MSWKLKGSPQTKMIDRKLAEQFMNMEAAPQDRALSERRLQVYEKIALVGHFRPVNWAAAYCKSTGGTYRVNGKHTSTLFSRLDLKALPPIHAVVEFYECDDLEDVSRLYATYDSSTQSRTVSDINRQFASCVPELANVHARLIQLCPSAVSYAVKGPEYIRMIPAERAEMLIDHSDFVVWADKVIGIGSANSHKSHIARMAVLAAMYLTFNSASRKAEEFWTLVRDESAPDNTDPSRKLARWLLLAGTTRSKSGTDRIRIKNKEYLVKSLHAWNAWRTGESTSLNYHADKPIPAVK